MQNAIRYKVTVTATFEQTENVGKDWKEIDQTVQDGTDKLKPVYGYTPEIQKTVRRDMQVYEQTVDQLNLAALVGVVNGLAGPNV